MDLSILYLRGFRGGNVYKMNSICLSKECRCSLFAKVPAGIQNEKCYGSGLVIEN